ncbi:dynein light chain Tctex-type protein 2B-like [Pectinophora gossypiella]|uniref:dynein light chain Tctex-type protein 2B-like n=1 Tax=Pectinophora gossypiella TaxID=13191 RepID=UPI00214E94E5|nr:dynein light chain Tctex-type protein 2B-like [Pectinophora gossypiella]
MDASDKVEAKASRASSVTLQKSTLKTDVRQSLSRIKVRKQSFGFRGVPGIKPIERTSQVAIEFKRPIPVYLPTYQLDPYVKFHHDDVLAIVDATLDELWVGHKYHEIESPSLAMRLAADIMHKIKSIQYNRYRIISVATIGQKRSQSYNNAIGFVWDTHRDVYVEVHREVTTAFVQITVFGVYLD